MMFRVNRPDGKPYAPAFATSGEALDAAVRKFRSTPEAKRAAHRRSTWKRMKEAGYTLAEGVERGS